MRDFLLAANWKMHKNPGETRAFFTEWKGIAARLPQSGPRGGRTRVLAFVPALSFAAAVDAVGASGQDLPVERARDLAIELGIQNAHHESKGAFTGENSAVVAQQMGAQWLLVGHSERRSLFHETDEWTSLKVEAGLKAGLKVMLCIGETLPEREAGQTDQVNRRQLAAGLSRVSPSILEASRLVIAYEPVWAIGTGKVATPEQANQAHVAIRDWLAGAYGKELAARTPILYGGSVKPDNAAQLREQSEIDGFLVGGASLEVTSFSALLLS